ncbi:MAG: formate/nitrite transporter family protein [Bacillota bacterium]|nr:formate/nitrite transporter family protein [Bacillota bacterium]
MNRCKTFLYAVMAGICIALGGAVFLSLDNKVLGALFFTVGLYTICTCGFALYTGKVCYIFENRKSYVIDLVVIWFGNLAGTWLTAAALSMTRIAGISEKAVEMCQIKLEDGLFSVFILAIFCNLLIFIAVDGFKNNPHEIGKYLALFFGVMVFILCGFEHCVANMFYISMAGIWNMEALGFILVNTLGNAVGGWIIPLLRKVP